MVFTLALLVIFLVWARAGTLVMLAFWLGTMPALLLAGASVRKLGEWTRRPTLRRLTGVMLLGIGVFALAMQYIHGSGHSQQEHQHQPS